MIFFKDIFPKHTVSHKINIIGRFHADHVPEMPWQAEIFHAVWQLRIGDILRLRRSCHQEFIAQLFEGIAAIEEGRLQNRMLHHGVFHRRGIHGAAQAILQEGIAAAMIRVGMRIKDRG